MSNSNTSPHKKSGHSLLATFGLKKRKSSKSIKKNNDTSSSLNKSHENKNISHRAATFSSKHDGNTQGIYSDIPVLGFHNNNNNSNANVITTQTTSNKMTSHPQFKIHTSSHSRTHSYSSGMSLSDKTSQINGFYNLPLNIGQSSQNNQGNNTNWNTVNSTSIVVGSVTNSNVNINGTKDNSSLLSATNHSFMAYSRYSISEPNLSLNSLENSPSHKPQLSNAQELLDAVFRKDNKNNSSSTQQQQQQQQQQNNINNSSSSNNEIKNATSGIHDQTMNNAKQLLQTFDNLLQNSNGKRTNSNNASQTPIITEPQPTKLSTDQNKIKFLDTTPQKKDMDPDATLTTTISQSRPSADIRRISLDSEPEKKMKKATVKSGTPNGNNVMMNENSNNSDSCILASMAPKRSFTPLNVKDIPSNALKLSINTARAGSSLVTGSFSRTRGNSMFSASPVSSRVTTQQDLELDNESPKKQLQGITYAPESKNKEFHKSFKKAPEDEKLISVQSAALFKDFMVQGKIYICDNNIYFYSNILGYITTYVIPYKDIIGIEKKNVAGIFPNAIGIDTEQTRYVFASLISRESTWTLTRKIWHQRRCRSMNPRDSITSSNQQGSESNEEFTADSEMDLDGDELLSDISSGDSESILEDDKNGVTSTPSSTVSEPIDETKKGKSVDDESIPTLGLSKHEPTTTSFTPDSADKKIYDSVIPAPLGKVINILFGENATYLETILKQQGNFDLSVIPTNLISTKNRDYSYTKPLTGSIGPKKTKCLVSEKVDVYDLDGFVQITQTTKNPDVPSGNAFVSCTTYVLSWDKNNSTRMSVYVRVIWSGNSWIKGAIENGTVDGVTVATKSLADDIIKLVSPKEKTTKKSKKGTSLAGKSVSTLPNIEPYTHVATKADIKTESGDKVIKENYLFDCSLGTTFQLIFGKDTSYLKRILAKQNNIDISVIPKFEDKKRTYTYVKLLNNSLGPKQTKCNITEHIEHMDMEKYIMVRQISKTPDVPSGNSFTVQTRYYLSWGPDNTTNLAIISNIVWSGRSFLKSAIEKGSIDGQKATVEILIDELTQIIEKAKTGPKVSKKKKTKGRKDISRASTLSEILQPEKVEPSGAINFISKAFSPLIDPLFNNFDVTSPQTVGSLFISFILLISLFRAIFVNEKDTHKISILREGKLMIDQDIYNYTPALDTLYRPYREDIENHASRGKNASSRDRYQNIVDSTEEGIWDWIKDRGNPKSVGRVAPHFDKPEIKNHNLEELQETIKIANIQLEEMKKRVSILQDTD
ncbi:similar to Saccharomyces cerevisiae YHR080C Protein of unknown function that may interact with ribosomes, based on co-purification experiments [Maudiozyma barnettii]|uniref:VASt domain-containing protein n=1 Tax=Maudiozyma barnettii TaxID=61262 RepID=A0A8H2VBT5_9SACH|nr:Lam4p [Kazachstania barnettii]CAB4252342.1 similar to Saccharomyces cerevisiae YHR080C Protein of unknown function that may interact with ribosomes, based on co- purification experiments [Kazachstania barnettii]CAD1779076.1 similar to Saccharomyces cerevisiae YHR080C Protein of unknown function that may interact with ribosomes, based on co-purification experiments [Kazachstania barnettii]